MKAAEQMMGLLDSPVIEQHSGQICYENLHCGFSSMQGWRRSMEDTHIIEMGFLTENGVVISIFGVFDGHGGDQVSKYCKLYYINILISTISFKLGDYQQALIDTNLILDNQLRKFETNDELSQIGSQESRIYQGLFGDLIASGTGCTAVIAMIVNNTIYCSNVGDSRCILFKNNIVIPMSLDHKPSLQSEAVRISFAGGVIENGRVNGNLNLTRTIGDLMYKNQIHLPPQNQIITCYPDITTQLLNGNEQLLVLACDGIWDVLSNEECIQKIINYLQQNYSIQQVCELILKDCLSKEPTGQIGLDNLTIIIIKFN